MQHLDQQSEQFALGILQSVKDMTLATVRTDGYPQATTVSFTNDGLTLYVGVGADSQKVDNIRQNNRVSMALVAPYENWDQIQGLSMAGIATIINDRDEMEHAAQCMVSRFPQLKTLIEENQALPWAGATLVRLSPQVISILDYTKGFGHTELYVVDQT